MEFDIVSVAAMLWDSGWRSIDRDQIKSEYNLTDEQTDAVCETLASFEDE